ncbi:MAG TPA: prolyl oligopeptidase family serine peptidase [Terriglobia bacterium]|nr:prolyl oligopeptidase family serine peptidase [Terriglobia bacterium]
MRVRFQGILLTLLFVPALLNGLILAANLDVESLSLDTDRMDRFLNREAERLGQEALERISTKVKLDAVRDQLRREFRFMIGLEPLPSRTPLEVKRVRTIDQEEYTIEVLSFQSLPHFYVTANLYKPKTGNPPFPAVIWGPGHSNDPHWNGAKALRQNYAIPWVRAGYICMIIDAFQVSELYGVHRGTDSFAMWDWYSRGYTPIGVEAWNAMRGADYLLSRNDVDRSKLTINGVSGGGHLSWMTGAADDRFAVVQPVAGAADLQTVIKLDLQRMHCDCAYFINTFRHDWSTLAGLIAPRPLFIQGSTEDPYYPPEGYRRLFEQAKQIYAAYGRADKVGLFEVPGPHDYTQAERERAVEWSDHWILGKDTTVKERPFHQVPGEQLSVFSGHPPPDSINDRVQELFIPVAQMISFKTRSAWEQKRSEILEKLKSVVFRNMPARQAEVMKSERKMEVGTPAFLSLETEPGIQIGIAMLNHSPASPGEKRPALIYIASPGETLETLLWNFLRVDTFNTIPETIYVVYPRGIGRRSWDDEVRRKFERDSMLLGRTLDEMRLYDVLCAVQLATALPGFDGKEISIAGKGVQGLIGAYAALLDERITRVILHSPPLTHKSGPIFLNILRYTDVPQALAMLAPRELIFLTHDIDSFDYTRAIYRLNGAERRFRRGYTIAQVLNQR